MGRPLGLLGRKDHQLCWWAPSCALAKSCERSELTNCLFASYKITNNRRPVARLRAAGYKMQAEDAQCVLRRPPVSGPYRAYSSLRPSRRF